MALEMSSPDSANVRPKVQCGVTKRNGEQCRAWSIYGTEKCAGHSGRGIARDPAAYAKRASERSAQVRADRAERRKAGLIDLVAMELERRAEAILEAYMAAGMAGDWRALEALVTRVHGKPVERVQTEDVGVDVDGMSDAQRAELRNRLLQAHPHLRAVSD